MRRLVLSLVVLVLLSTTGCAMEDGSVGVYARPAVVEVGPAVAVYEDPYPPYGVWWGPYGTWWHGHYYRGRDARARAHVAPRHHR
jgi:hypothetical protein